MSAYEAAALALGEHILDCEPCQHEIGPGCATGERLVDEAAQLATAEHQQRKGWAS